ncbi:MAG: FtsQ-type POTRA domain-containing protein [Stagnimonas sp.]|nr:FtsQ-type POTRA domain-containing protein [Stagnimonas sp.]
MSVLTLSMPMPFFARNDNSTGGMPPALRKTLLSLAALAAALVAGRLLLARVDAQPRELVVQGLLQHVRADEVRAAAATAIDGRLFEVDLDAVRLAVERLPWVAHARVDRQWPARLVVRIWERVPFARWGAAEALSTEGRVFAPGPEPLAATLPQLDGAPGREREVMTMYRQLADRLAETPLALAGLRQDARGDWMATTQSGVALRFGRSSPLDQVERLKTVVLPSLAPRLAEVRTVDLRYLNGYAVSWREPAPTSATTSTGAVEPETPLDAVPGVTP